MEKTPQVLRALGHVQKFHPTLHKVHFDEEGMWQYMDKNDMPFEFSDEVEPFILEDALDSLDTFPITIFV
jgi:hypothetical protein